MKQVYLVLLALILAANPLFPQKPGKKSVFGANAGLTVPYNEFAQNELNYDCGFASPGANIEAEYLYYGKYFGFSSSIGYASIFFNEKDYQAEYDRVLDGYGINEVTAGNFQVMKLLVGFTFKVPEINHTEVMLLFHLGYALSVHPDILVTNTEMGVINSISRDAGGSPVCNTGLKINYWLNENYGLTLNGGMNLTWPSFYDQTSFGGTFTMPIHYANINFGIVMNLNNSAQ